MGAGGSALSVSWPISFVECSDTEAYDGMTAAQQELVRKLAAEFLWTQTGGQFGLIELLIRPCRKNCAESSTPPAFDHRAGSPWSPALVGGQWFNFTCGRCGDLCSCGGETRALNLPGQLPVHSIQRVVIDGVELSPAAYRVDNHRLLVRMDGHGWPVCQDMSKPDGALGTWSITYSVGTTVPLGGSVAAGLLAVEMAKALCNDGSCQLPERVQTITRQGVTVAVVDKFEGLDKGRTGIWMIDSWLASVTARPISSRVYSPDIPRVPYRRATWPFSGGTP